MRTAPALLALLLLLPGVAAIEIQASTPFLHGSTGDSHHIATSVTNDGPTPTGRLVVSMNIVNLGDDRVVDPEDWSPQRSQYMQSLGPKETVSLDWTIYSILGGDYAVYFVVIEAPPSPQESGATDVSAAVHLVVEERPQYNPGGILPFTIGVPLLVAATWLGLRWLRRRQIDDA